MRDTMFEGTFDKKDAAEIGKVHVVYDHGTNPGGGTCSYEDPYGYEVYLEDEDATPFRMAPLLAVL